VGCAGEIAAWLSLLICVWVDLSEVAGVLSAGVVFVDAVDVAVTSDAALCMLFANVFVSESVGRIGNAVDGERSDCGSGVVADAVLAIRVCGNPTLIAFAAAAFFDESF